MNTAMQIFTILAGLSLAIGCYYVLYRLSCWFLKANYVSYTFTRNIYRGAMAVAVINVAYIIYTFNGTVNLTILIAAHIVGCAAVNHMEKIKSHQEIQL